MNDKRARAFLGSVAASVGCGEVATCHSPQICNVSQRVSFDRECSVSLVLLSPKSVLPASAFAKLRKATVSFVMSVRPHETTRLSLDEFS